MGVQKSDPFCSKQYQKRFNTIFKIILQCIFLDVFSDVSSSQCYSQKNENDYIVHQSPSYLFPILYLSFIHLFSNRNIVSQVLRSRDLQYRMSWHINSTEKQLRLRRQMGQKNVKSLRQCETERHWTWPCVMGLVRDGSKSRPISTIRTGECERTGEPKYQIKELWPSPLHK